MKRLLKECPRYRTSQLRDEKKRAIVDCSACAFSVNKSKRCRLAGVTKKEYYEFVGRDVELASKKERSSK